MPMATMPLKREATKRTNVHATLPLDLVARSDEMRAQLVRLGIKVSFSSLVEVALEELLVQKDLPSVLRKRRASARRQ